jgi:DNA-binding winged helix-turn-helix (wHTH) protein
MGNDQAQSVWQLGPWQVIPARNRLQNEHTERTVEPRVMTALMVLIEAQGNVVSDEKLLAGVWAGQIVSDASLYKVIAELRKALGDSEKPYQFIEGLYEINKSKLANVVSITMKTGSV